ncbi:MAG: hypothetical protein IPJ28_14895 [Betaproteobacteria bacterium]|nr:hypothetical protein [Betaproteobacteria bacterium]
MGDLAREGHRAVDLHVGDLRHVLDPMLDRDRLRVAGDIENVTVPASRSAE